MARVKETPSSLREKAKKIIEAAKAEAKTLRANADELEAQEDLELLKQLKASGKLDQLRKEMGTTATAAGAEA